MWSSKCTSVTAATVLVAAVTLSSSAARAEEPSGTHLEKRARKEFVWSGSILFTSAYITSAAIATTGYEHADDSVSQRGFLWIPIAGPFVMMGSANAGENVLLALDGLAQMGGLSLMIYGLVTPAEVVVPDAPPHEVTVSVSPWISPVATGATFRASF